MQHVPFPVDAALVLRRWEGPQQFQQPERQEPLMLEDIRRDEEGEGGGGPKRFSSVKCC